MGVKWIITDIDGCMSPEESVPWDLERFGQFSRLVREANAGRGTIAPMTLCTGRPQPYVELLMKILDVRAAAICESGAVLYSLHDNWARYGPGVTAEKIAQLRALRTFIEQDVLPDEPKALIQFGKESQISVFSRDPGIFPRIRRRVERFAAEHGGPELDITPSHFYLNICLAGVSKGSTVKALLDELGVSREQSAGIGDTDGDLPLRDAVGFFACPANSTSAVKAAADYVSPYPMLEGMLDILNRPEMRR